LCQQKNRIYERAEKKIISTTTNTLKKQKRKIKTSTTTTTKILVHLFSKDSRVSSGIKPGALIPR
jgi:hypothetical protein